MPAAPYDVKDMAHWRREIARLNSKYLGYEWPAAADGGPVAESDPPITEPQQFPIVDHDILLRSPKAAKRVDLERMYSSPRSEDYVTWTVTRALARLDRQDWWPALVQLAESDAVGGSGLDSRVAPEVHVWRVVNTPPGYERASRERMRASGNAKWRNRTLNPRSVEGPSEIDIVFETDAALLFVEAKLRSDLSTGTKYDPARNQLIRVIDCAVEEAGERAPRCWLITPDRHPQRLYTDIVGRYRDDPSAASRLLPHRDPEQVRAVVEHLAVIMWREILDAVEWNTEDATLAAALDEVRRRL